MVRYLIIKDCVKVLRVFVLRSSSFPSREGETWVEALNVKLTKLIIQIECTSYHLYRLDALPTI